MQGKTTIYFFVGMTLFFGFFLVFIPVYFGLDSIWETVLSNIGVGIIATSMISLFLEISWTKQKADLVREQFKEIFDQWQKFTDRLTHLEGRLSAFKQLGLNYCHKNRDKALKRFYTYAAEKIERSKNTEDCLKHVGYINIVSSSARGLMGYLDREPSNIQNRWRELITNHPAHFRFLLTHPAYAHLRQPAEERESGDIELEIIKTAIYLHCICGMGINQLRLYRGSPTVFQIQVDRHILLNPYPYGKMAMDTLSLEFESVPGEDKENYIEGFSKMHFNHTWAFLHQPGKRVEDKPLIVGISHFEDILRLFGECTFVNDSNRLRFSKPQVEELDYFTSVFLKGRFPKKLDNFPDEEQPFENYIKKENPDITFNEKSYVPYKD